MVVSEDLGAVRHRGLMARVMAIMEWMRAVDTTNRRGRGGRVAGRSGRTGGGGNRVLVVGRRVVGRSDSPSNQREWRIVRWNGVGKERRCSGCVTIDRNVEMKDLM